MMPGEKSGPRSHEAASNDYLAELNDRLRLGRRRGWRSDAFILLFQEYDKFERLAVMGDFTVQSMWDYMRLVEVSDWYLRDHKLYNFSAWFYMKARQGLAIIEAQSRPFQFDRREWESVRMANDRLERVLSWWKAPERVRE